MSSCRAPMACQLGWASSEYLAVLIGLMAIWRASQAMLYQLQRSQADFLWTLMIP